MHGLQRSLLVIVFALPSCAFGTHETEATNVGEQPHDAGVVLQEGSIGLPQDSAVDSADSADRDADQDADLDAAPADGDPSLCASSPDGTVCATAPDACHDDGVCEGSVCVAPAPKADGTACGTADGCHDAPSCESGQCVEHAKPDGTSCASAPDACHTDGMCAGGVCGAPKARADGYNWDPSDSWKRCCGGKALRMDTDANCGVCGVQCNPSNGESCALNAANNQYYCTGCNASSACWSGCCSNSYGTPRRCAASDCVQGLCVGCPDGSCKQWSNASNSCSYE